MQRNLVRDLRPLSSDMKRRDFFIDKKIIGINDRGTGGTGMF